MNMPLPTLATFAAYLAVMRVTVIVWKELSGGVFDVYEQLSGFIFATVAIVVVSQPTGRPSAEVAEQFSRSRRSTAE